MNFDALSGDGVTELRAKIKTNLAVFIAGLVISGLTAFPLELELRLLVSLSEFFNLDNDLSFWIAKVNTGVVSTGRQFPFMAYGTDWLAFAHLVIAIAFVGPFRDPVRNKWVVEFGLIACFAVFPLAILAGAVRGIPWFWRCIDCAFGFAGGWMLMVCLKKINRLEKLTEHEF